MHKIISRHTHTYTGQGKIEKKQQKEREKTNATYTTHWIEVSVSIVTKNACHMIEYLSHTSGHNVTHCV